MLEAEVEHLRSELAAKDKDLAMQRKKHAKKLKDMELKFDKERVAYYSSFFSWA